MMFQNREPKPKSSHGIGNLNLLVSVIFDIYPKVELNLSTNL